MAYPRLQYKDVDHLITRTRKQFRDLQRKSVAATDGNASDAKDEIIDFFKAKNPDPPSPSIGR